MTDPRPRPDAVPAARPAGRLGIGEVVAALEAEFPGVTASKVRFLEERGLVLPERTSAGYRRFRPEDGTGSGSSSPCSATTSCRSR